MLLSNEKINTKGTKGTKGVLLIVPLQWKSTVYYPLFLKVHIKLKKQESTVCEKRCHFCSTALKSTPSENFHFIKPWQITWLIEVVLYPIWNYRKVGWQNAFLIYEAQRAFKDKSYCHTEGFLYISKQFYKDLWITDH